MCRMRRFSNHVSKLSKWVEIDRYYKRKHWYDYYVNETCNDENIFLFKFIDFFQYRKNICVITLTFQSIIFIQIQLENFQFVTD